MKHLDQDLEKIQAYIGQAQWSRLTRKLNGGARKWMGKAALSLRFLTLTRQHLMASGRVPPKLCLDFVVSQLGTPDRVGILEGYLLLDWANDLLQNTDARTHAEGVQPVLDLAKATLARRLTAELDPHFDPLQVPVINAQADPALGLPGGAAPPTPKGGPQRAKSDEAAAHAATAHHYLYQLRLRELPALYPGLF
jgi:hypothetical protein